MTSVAQVRVSNMSAASQNYCLINCIEELENASLHKLLNIMKVILNS